MFIRLATDLVKVDKNGQKKFIVLISECKHFEENHN